MSDTITRIYHNSSQKTLSVEREDCLQYKKVNILIPVELIRLRTINQCGIYGNLGGLFGIYSQTKDKFCYIFQQLGDHRI